MIPCANPRAQYESHRAEIDAAIAAVLDRGRYILGESVNSFERDFARYIGVEHGIAVGNGTDALHLAIRALGIGAGDEVITVAHTAVATVAAIEMAGATPVFVDIEPSYYTIDVHQIEAAITPRTRAIVAVHIYGGAADLDALLDICKRRDLRLIEDCAQAHGARLHGRRLGSFGDVACFSFYPTKNLGAIGDGGMIVTNDADVAHRTRLLREYGWAERYVSHIAGFNSRLDELQAAVLAVKLRHLDADNGRRASIAAQYDAGLRESGVTIPSSRPDSRPVHHLYVIRSSRRDELLRHLTAADIGVLVHYPVPVHQQPAYTRFARPLPQTERAAREVLSLPMFPELDGGDVARVIDAVANFPA
jgi:dTDP-4-amino-4,6-dideoxygalactose transaminase